MLMGIAHSWRAFMDIYDWKKKYSQKPAPQYTHFDRRISLKNCFSYITSANKISSHGFYPFIHCTIKSRKVKNGKKAKPKTRQIYYAAHLDGWIYRYYAYLINEAYNNRVKLDGINEVAVAYRTDLRDGNIQLAKRAFDCIRKMQPCYIMIGDFTSFFDNLDHAYLKAMLCDLLSVNRLPEDFYAVYKNITHFSYVELEDLLALRGYKNTRKGRKAFNSYENERALTPEEFRKNRSLVKSNLNSGHGDARGYGIPQGSPISAVLANVYMLEGDKRLQEYVSSQDGFYMRYSDDFIVVLPISNIDFSVQYASIKAILSSIPNLKLESSKTKLFCYKDTVLKNCTDQFIFEGTSEKNTKNIIEFLGFSFDGECVRIRDKTISKYYNRLYRKVRTIIKSGGHTRKGHQISCRNLYEKYSYKGSAVYRKKRAQKTGVPLNEDQKSGNFHDYVSRAKAVFHDIPTDKVTIGAATRRHMQKIKKQLKTIRKVDNPNC